jgi:putative FmdB family regulatory protein
VPLYEYQCPQCGRFEIIQRFSDAVLSACPTCGKDVQKLLSAPAIQFKGTGWYVTDYARKGGGEGPPKGAASEPTAKEATKTSAPTATSKDGAGGGGGSSPK